MPNTNYLKSIQCPACGSEGPFWITVETIVLMKDDGCWDESTGDIDTWGDWSFIRCNDCDEEGVVSDFRSTTPN